MYNYYTIFSRYQIIEECINDAINIFQIGNYTNTTTPVGAFEMRAKTVHSKLREKFQKDHNYPPIEL